jgi:hypothetical protein
MVVIVIVTRVTMIVALVTVVVVLVVVTLDVLASVRVTTMAAVIESPGTARLGPMRAASLVGHRQTSRSM